MASDVKLGLDADTSAYNAKMKTANEEVKKIGKSNKKQKSEWQKQIPILGKLNTLMGEGVLKAGAIALAVGLIAKAWINVERAREQALSENLAASGGSKLLAQISTSPEQTIQLKALSQQLAAVGNISEDRAARAIFALGSGGNLGDFGTVQQIAQIDPNLEQTISGAQTSAAAFGGTFQKSANRLLAASKQSKFSLSEIAAGVAVGGAAFGAQGGTESQFLAAIGGDPSVKSADIAGTALQSFALATTKDPKLARFNKGGGPIDTAQNLKRHMDERGIDQSQLGRFISSIDAQRGFRILLANFAKGDFQTRVAQIEGVGNVIGEAVANRDPFAVAGEQLQAAKAILSLANRPAGIEETKQEALKFLRLSETAQSNFIVRESAAGLNFIADILQTEDVLTATQLREAISSALLREIINNQKVANDLLRADRDQAANAAQRGVKD